MSSKRRLEMSLILGNFYEALSRFYIGIVSFLSRKKKIEDLACHQPAQMRSTHLPFA
jgi:hypothetical protein